MLHKKLILTIGDSHIRVFESNIFTLFFPSYKFKVVYVPGATISGIHNMNSVTNAYNIFNEALKKNNYSKIIVTLGEVDTAYTMWSKSINENISIEKLMEDNILKYSAFLTTLSSYADVIVLSATLATVKENEECSDNISGIRASTSITQEKRTQLGVLQNSKIELFCKNSQKLQFINFDSIVLGRNKVVKKWILNHKNKCDHHYKRWIFALLIVYKLKKLL